MSFKTEIDRFGELFKRRLIDNSKATLRWVSAGEVDWENKTMTAKGDDDLDYHDVLLGVGSVTVKPIVGTDCLIAMVENNESTSFLLFADEVELVQFNEGKNGGALIIEPFLNQLNDMVEKFNSHVHTGVIVAVTGGSGAPAVGSPGNSGKPAVQAGKFAKKDFEDIKLTH